MCVCVFWLVAKATELISDLIKTVASCEEGVFSVAAVWRIVSSSEEVWLFPEDENSESFKAVQVWYQQSEYFTY